MIQFSKPTIGLGPFDQFPKNPTNRKFSDEYHAIAKILESGWLAAGPETALFEEEFSNYISPPGEHYYCIFTNSCTSALKMAYKWLGEQEDIPNGITYPNNTFCATYSAASEMGLDIIFYSEFNNPTGLVAPRFYHSQFNRVNVHYGSIKDETPCLIEDSAHRIEPNDPLVGKIRCYSFYATKNMTTGSGGMFVTNDKEIYERARLFWRDGISTTTLQRATGSVGYTVEAFSGGYDSNDLAAALGRVQLRRLPGFTKRRNEIRDRYNQAFGSQWQGNHLFPFFVSSEDQVFDLIAFLKSKEIQASYHYPGTGWLGVSLPIYPLLSDEEVETVINAVKEWQNLK